MTQQQRTAIVTGGARGIGAATAVRLAADGHRVAVLDLEESAAKATVEAIVGGGAPGAGWGAAGGAAAAVEAAVGAVVEKLGNPTILVNNAGITKDNLLFKMSEGDWDAVMGVHLKGSFLMTRAVQKYMVEAKWGRVVNLSSTSALGNRGQANYSAAKAGLQGFTKTLAIELGKFGVTANCIAPGFIASEMTKATAERLGVDWDEFKAARAAEIPVQRPGAPEDIANAVSFFVDERSSVVCGQVVFFAGGPKT